MRKYVGMVLALICIVTLIACGSDKKITLDVYKRQVQNVGTRVTVSLGLQKPDEEEF